MTGCRTTPDPVAFNRTDPGWRILQGQAVWRSPPHRQEIAGELLVATHPAQGSFIEFSKTPLPILTAENSSNTWRIRFASERRTFSGHNPPPPTFAWLHLARCLNGEEPPLPLHFQRLEGGSWRLENPRTGEVISGVVLP